MSAEAVYEFIGYAGSILIVVSLAMSSIIRLRVINLVGAATFAFYGFLIGSVPVLVTNIVIVGLDIWYLGKELSAREELTVLSLDIEDSYVREFLRFYGDDIQRFRPGFGMPTDADVVFLMLRDVAPAGIFVGREITPGVLGIDLDYAAPPFRDHRCGGCLYGKGGRRFSALGWNILSINDVHERQIDYFRKMDFADAGDGTMTRVISGA